MTPFLWILAGGFLLGIVLMIVFGIAKKQAGVTAGICLAVVCSICFIIDITVEPYKNGYTPPSEEIGATSFSEIYQAYKENEIVADDQYKGNRYQVTGEIAGISNDGLLNIGGGATLTINIELENVIVVAIATFKKDQVESLKTVKVGDTVTFTGKCLSYGSWSECKLVGD